MKNNVIVFIPVRGGSKGILDKNIKLIAGKPLICYSIDAALKAEIVNKIIISTDSQKIKQVVYTYYGNINTKIEIFDRSIETATDTATTESAMLDFAKRYDSKFEDIILVQATSPLIESIHIDEAYNQYLKESLGGLLSVVRQKRFVWDETAPLNYEPSNRPRRQDFKGLLIENGALYITSKKKLQQSNCRISEPYGTYVMPDSSYYEIDEPEDWVIVEALLHKKNKTEVKNKLPTKIEAIVFDFDGVFTDNKVIVFEDGKEAVICSRGDGMGIEQLKKQGIPIWVLSKEKNPVLLARCKKLGIACEYGIENKLQRLEEQIAERKLNMENIIYVGNDINDIECLSEVGCPIVVQDAHLEAKKHAKIILQNKGGDGAIRELTDLILS